MENKLLFTSILFNDVNICFNVPYPKLNRPTRRTGNGQNNYLAMSRARLATM